MERTLTKLVIVATASLCIGSIARAQTDSRGPAVELDPEIACWARGEHSTAVAFVNPLAPIARLYFRCSLYPDYYFVNLEQQGDVYSAVLPQATEECPSVFYYLEAVSSDYASSRTRERSAEVSEASECRRRDPLVALFTGDANIFVGATSALAPEMAPGFSVSGVAGFISAGGVASGGSGGGLGTAALAGIGGAAAGGAVLVTNTGGTSGDDAGDTSADEMTPVAGGEPAPAPPTAPPPASPSGDTAPLACVTTDPRPAIIGVGDAIRLDASCSKADRVGDSGDRIAEYLWDFSDGRQKTGRVVQAVFREPGVYDVTLTVIDSAASIRPQRDTESFEITVEDRVDACFTASDFDPGTGCKVKVDGRCSSGDIELFEWNFSDGFGNYRFTGPTVVKDWVSCPLNTTVTLTVTSSTGATDFVRRDVFVNFLRETTESPRLDVLASIEGEESAARVVVNGQATFDVQASSPRRLHPSARSGVNVVSVEAATSGGSMTLDFSNTRGLIPGSLLVRDGEVLAVSSNVVVLRLGRPGRVEFRLR